MKKKVLEITCDRCPRHTEVAVGSTRLLAKSGWVHTRMAVIGRMGRPVAIDLCPIHARPMLKALVKIDPATQEVR